MKLLIGLALVLCACSDIDRQCEEYKFQDHVKIVDGFYAGQTGVVTVSYGWGGCDEKYHVVLDLNGQSIDIDGVQLARK